MTKYANLVLDKAYLIIEKEGEAISLVQILMESTQCVLIEIHGDEDMTFWKKKSDSIFELVEELTDDQVDTYLELFEDDEEDFDDEDEEDL